MADQAPPTFKLVLVGDGGTGKVSRFLIYSWAPVLLQEQYFDESIYDWSFFVREFMTGLLTSIPLSSPLPRDPHQ